MASERIDPVQEIFKRASGKADPIPIISPMEEAFDAFGLMSGPLSPVYRAAVGFGVGSAVMWSLRPAFAFDRNGTPRPWVHSLNAENATEIPWWLVPSGLAIFCGVFV